MCYVLAVQRDLNPDPQQPHIPARTHAHRTEAAATTNKVRHATMYL